MNNKPWRFFFDMDGFIVDFDKEFKKHMPGHTEETDWEWQELHSKCPDIYRIAPPLEEGMEVLDYLSKYSRQWHILTAIPKRWSWPNVTHHKREWVLQHIREIPPTRICFGPYAEDKQFHCTGVYDVLIDDKLRNISQWRNRGGTGIYFQGNAEDVIRQLEKYGI